MKTKIILLIGLVCLALVSACKEDPPVTVPMKAPDLAYYSLSSVLFEYGEIFPLPTGRVRNIRLEFVYNFQSGFNRVLQGEERGGFSSYLLEYIKSPNLAEFQYNEARPGVWVMGNYNFTLQDSTLIFTYSGDERLEDFPFAFGTFKPGEPLTISLTFTHSTFRTSDYRAQLTTAGFTQDTANAETYTKAVRNKKYVITIDNATAVCLIQS